MVSIVPRLAALIVKDPAKCVITLMGTAPVDVRMVIKETCVTLVRWHWVSGYRGFKKHL